MTLAASGWYEAGPNTTSFQKAHSVPRHPSISLLSRAIPEQENPSTLLSEKCLCCDGQNWKILGGKYLLFKFPYSPLPLFYSRFLLIPCVGYPRYFLSSAFTNT